MIPSENEARIAGFGMAPAGLDPRLGDLVALLARRPPRPTPAFPDRPGPGQAPSLHRLTLGGHPLLAG